MTKLLWSALAICAVWLGVTPSVAAQQYPSKPLRLIVPFPAGGGSDVVGRIVAKKLSERLGQQVVIDNKGGAGGSIGTGEAVRAAPDGYTMVLASTSEIAVNPALYSKLGYDTAKDLTAVAMVASTPIVIVANPTLPIKNVGELIQFAKAKPGTLNVASAGNGSFTHLSGELFRSLAGLTWTHVPYKGAAPAMTDLVAGQVQLMFSALPAAMPFIKNSQLSAIAVSTSNRSPALPEVPTVSSSGLPAYEVVFWYGIFVPSATPREVVDRLADEIAQTLKSSDVVDSLAAQGAEPGSMTSAKFSAFVSDEVQKWGKVVKSSGAKVD